MKIQKLLFILSLLLTSVFTQNAAAQVFGTYGQVFPSSFVDGKRIINGFTPVEGSSNENTFSNVMIWAVNNISDELRNGLNDINIENRSFTFITTLASEDTPTAKNVYTCKFSLRVENGKLMFLVNNVMVESQMLMLKKVTPLEKLQPEKKEAHKDILNEFEALASKMILNITEFAQTNKHLPITHWNEIKSRRPVVGMNTDECLIAFGKPKTISEQGGETQWMYNTSFYLFFRNNKVASIVK